MNAWEVDEEPEAVPIVIAIHEEVDEVLNCSLVPPNFP